MSVSWFVDYSGVRDKTDKIAGLPVVVSMNDYNFRLGTHEFDRRERWQPFCLIFVCVYVCVYYVRDL